MSGIMRLGRIEIRVLDLEESFHYYTNVIGLEETGRDHDRVYLKAWDEYDHHSIILQKSDRAGMDHLAFKVKDIFELEKLERKIEQFGCSLQRVSSGRRLGEGEAIRFEIPTGHNVELYSDIKQIGTATGVINPDPWPDYLRGIAPHRLDHALLTGEDLETVTRFFKEVLDFHQTEKIVTVDGETMVGSFLSVTNKAHDLAFVKGPDKKFHHAGFYVDNWYEVLKAADILSKNKVQVEVTPTRHGITRGQTVYFFDPSSNRNEAFASGYLSYADFPTITWTEDQIGTGIFYHRRELVDSFAKALLLAEENCQSIAPLTDKYPDLSPDDAYQIQLLQIEEKTKKGAKIVGKKIGLTSEVMQQMFQVNEPDYGHLLDDMMHIDGETISLDSFIQPKLEAEIAFIFKKDLKGPSVTLIDVIQSIAYVVPAFEIIDSRIENWQIHFEDTVADNGSSARAVLGGKPSHIEDIDLVHIGMHVIKNGDLIDTATGAAVMGNPLHAVVWLANALGKFDIALHAGEVILSGALTKAIPVQAGDTFTAKFAHLGSVSVRFEKGEK